MFLVSNHINKFDHEQTLHKIAACRGTDLIRKYRNSDITAESLHNSLDVDALDGAALRLRLELDANDIASIYETENFSVTEQNEAFTVWAGDAILAQCKYDSNVPQE